MRALKDIERRISACIGLAMMVTLVFSCRQESQETQPTIAMYIAEVDDLLEQSDGDSALVLLESITNSICQYPEETQKYWHLLTIQAKDKQYIVHF